MVINTRHSLRDAKCSWEKLSLFLHAGGRGGQYHLALHAVLTSPDAYAKYLKARAACLHTR